MGALLLIGVFVVVPAMVACVRATHENEGPSEGSELYRARQPFVWAATLLTLDPSFVAAAGITWEDGHRVFSLSTVLVLLVGKVVFIGLMWHALRGLRRLAAEAAALDPIDGVSGASTRITWVGIGEDCRGRLAPFAGYREAPTLERVIFGDPREAERCVRERLAYYGYLHLALYGLPAAIGVAIILGSLAVR